MVQVIRSLDKKRRLKMNLIHKKKPQAVMKSYIKFLKNKGWCDVHNKKNPRKINRST